MVGGARRGSTWRLQPSNGLFIIPRQLGHSPSIIISWGFALAHSRVAGVVAPPRHPHPPQSPYMCACVRSDHFLSHAPLHTHCLNPHPFVVMAVHPLKVSAATRDGSCPPLRTPPPHSSSFYFKPSLLLTAPRGSLLEEGPGGGGTWLEELKFLPPYP